MATLARSLQRHGFSAGGLHGDMDQKSRMETLDAFKTDKLQLLIASDVAARGLDIPAVSHVFNFDVPTHAEDYIHRIGRTGRAGRSGISITLATPSDGKYLDAIVRLIQRDIPLMQARRRRRPRRRSPATTPERRASAAPRRPRSVARERRERSGRKRRAPRPTARRGRRAARASRPAAARAARRSATHAARAAPRSRRPSSRRRDERPPQRAPRARSPDATVGLAVRVGRPGAGVPAASERRR